MSGLTKKVVSVVKPKPVTPVVTTTPAAYIPGSLPMLPTSWQRKFADDQVAQGAHPERAAWDKFLYNGIYADRALWLAARDLKTVIPRADEMTEVQKISALCELAVQVFKYECDWNPANTSTDVNGKSDPASLATGFCQLNVADQSSFNLGTNYSHEQLKDPYNNMTCFFGLMRYVLKANGKITWTKGVDHKYFFETLAFGVKWLTLPKSLAYVAKYSDEMLKLP